MLFYSTCLVYSIFGIFSCVLISVNNYGNCKEYKNFSISSQFCWEKSIRLISYYEYSLAIQNVYFFNFFLNWNDLTFFTSNLYRKPFQCCDGFFFNFTTNECTGMWNYSKQSVWKFIRKILMQKIDWKWANWSQLSRFITCTYQLLSGINSYIQHKI